MKHSRGRAEGMSLLEVMAAVWLSLAGLLAATPAFGIALKVLVHDQATLDQELATEGAWNEVLRGGIPTDSRSVREISVGEGRSIPVTLERLGDQGGFTRWRLSVSNPSSIEERWMSK